MAQHYNQFSTEITFINQESLAWFRDCLAVDPDDVPGDDELDEELTDADRKRAALAKEMEDAGIRLSDYPFSGIEAGREGDTCDLWVYAEEAGDLGAVADLVALYQRKYNDDSIWSASSSASCSKPRLDEFGGCAVVVKDGQAHWISTWDWIAEKCKELKSASNTQPMEGNY